MVLTHRLLKYPSVSRTKTSEAQPNTAPAKHRHSTRPVKKVSHRRTLRLFSSVGMVSHANTNRQFRNYLFSPAGTQHTQTGFKHTKLASFNASVEKGNKNEMELVFRHLQREVIKCSHEHIFSYNQMSKP